MEVTVPHVFIPCLELFWLQAEMIFFIFFGNPPIFGYPPIFTQLYFASQTPFLAVYLLKITDFIWARSIFWRFIGSLPKVNIKSQPCSGEGFMLLKVRLGLGLGGGLGGCGVLFHPEFQVENTIGQFKVVVLT